MHIYIYIYIYIYSVRGITHVFRYTLTSIHIPAHRAVNSIFARLLVCESIPCKCVYLANVYTLQMCIPCKCVYLANVYTLQMCHFPDIYIYIDMYAYTCT